MKMQEIYKILSENRDKDNILVTVVEGQGNGARFFFSEGKLLAETGEALLSETEKAILSGSEESGIMEAGGRKIFVEHLRKTNRLVICGGGHVAQQAAFLASRAGFHVTALEDRPSFADAMRRSGADDVICDSFGNALAKISGGSDSYFLVLTRGHRYDGICLRAILQKERAYVGMMASRGRAAAMKKELSCEGISRDILDKIHSPVGLPIHAETPAEIAVSIVAELIMTKNRSKKSSGYDSELLSWLTAERPENQKIALATIIARRGSAPREIGTKMAVAMGGKTVGTVGGGCMESRIIHQCLGLLKEEHPKGRLTKENMTGEEAEEEGLVCGGTIQVYLEVL